MKNSVRLLSSSFLVLTFLSLGSSLGLAAEKKAPAKAVAPAPSAPAKVVPQTQKVSAPAYSSVVAAPPSSDHNIGLGIMLGEPSGISGKYIVDSKTAYDAGLTYSFSSFLMLFGDYLWQFDPHFLEPNNFTRNLKLYVGGGGGLKFSTKDDIQRRKDDDDSLEVFVRVPVGAEWRPSDPPLGVFFELAPGLKIIPGISGMFFAALGVRLYF